MGTLFWKMTSKNFATFNHSFNFFHSANKTAQFDNNLRLMTLCHSTSAQVINNHSSVKYLSVLQITEFSHNWLLTGNKTTWRVQSSTKANSVHQNPYLNDFQNLAGTSYSKGTIDREFEFYNFFSFLKFNKFYNFFSVEKFPKNL